MAGSPLEPGKAKRFQRLALLAIGIHFLLALTFSVLIPPWEAHDEWAHYKYVEYVARHKHLPPPGIRLTTEFTYDEATQPPLYYILAALPLIPIVPHDAYTPQINPYASSTHGQGGRNLVIHDPTVEAFPWKGTILALHVARWTSVVLGTLGLWITWHLALLLFRREDIAAWAVTLHALIPQYVFIGSVVTNDILLAVLSTAVLYLMAKVLFEPLSARTTLTLGVVLILDVLTKYLALAFIPLALVVLTVALTRTRSRRVRWLGPGLASLGVLLATLGWMYYNLIHTGTPIPRDPHAVEVILSQSPWEWLIHLPWSYMPHILLYGFRTLWASFGWGNVEPGVGVTYGFALLMGWGILGWLRDGRRGRISHRETWGAVFLLSTVIIMAVLPILRELIYGEKMLRGRYVLTALAVFSVLWARGARPWVPRGREIAFQAVLALGLLALNIYSLWGVILPAYRPHGIISAEEATLLLTREEFSPVYVRYGNAVELRGFKIVKPMDVKEGIRVGSWAEVELLWHVLAPLTPDHSIFIQILGRENLTYGQTITYPEKGTYPTHLWQKDTWFRERYWIHTEAGGPLPTTAGFGVLLILDRDPQPRLLPVYDRKGHQVHNVVRVGRFRLAPDKALPLPAPLCPIDARVGIARLVGATLPAQGRAGEPFRVDLHWRVEGSQPHEEMVVFLHVETLDGTVIATGDSAPQRGDFPTTFWHEGDVFIDPHVLSLPVHTPPDTYALVVGMYQRNTGERWPVWDREGHSLTGRALRVGWVHVDKEGKATLQCAVTTDHAQGGEANSPRHKE